MPVVEEIPIEEIASITEEVIVAEIPSGPVTVNSIGSRVAA